MSTTPPVPMTSPIPSTTTSSRITAKGDDDCTQRGQGVESGEGGSSGRDRERDEHQAEDSEEPTLLEQGRPARPRESLEPADTPNDERDGLSRCERAELAPTPTFGQQDRAQSKRHLDAQHHGDQLEDVSDAARRKWQCGHEHQEQDRDREALLGEHVTECPERLGRVALEPALELGAELFVGFHCFGGLTITVGAKPQKGDSATWPASQNNSAAARSATCPDFRDAAE